MTKVIDHEVLYRDERFHAAFPSIVRFSDGCLLLAFRRARDGSWLIPEAEKKSADLLNRMDHIDSRSHIMLMEFNQDGSKLLAQDMLPIDPEAADQDPSLCILDEDRVFLASFSYYPLPADAAQYLSGREPPGEEKPGCRFLFWGSHVSARTRMNNEWQYHHRYILPGGGFGNQVSPGGEKQVTGPARGQPLIINDEIYLALYGGEPNHSVVFKSNKEAQDWQFVATIARDPDGAIAYQEPTLCEDGQGGMVCFMRTSGADGRLASSHSLDGKKWSKPHLHQLWGHPFNALTLKDGRVLLTYGFRKKPFGVRARLMDTVLQDPDLCEEIIIREDAINADVGYPWAVELDDQKVLVVYYMTDKSGIRYIAGSRLEIVEGG